MNQQGSAALRRNRRWFRAAAITLPFLLLLFLEGGLRLAGFGYPTSFFLDATQDGRATVIENQRFGWRFFPPGIARSPHTLAFAAEKAPGTTRVFLFGESAAQGDPEPSFGLARQLQALLGERHSQHQWEVINVAMTAINSHAIREIARDSRSRSGDIWLVYAGNNEVVGPFGAGTVFNKPGMSLASIRAKLALDRLRTGQLLSGIGRGQKRQMEWLGMEMFEGQRVEHSDPRLRMVYDHFEANLSDIIDFGHQAGVHVVLSTVAVNLKQCPPFLSAHGSALTAEKEAQWKSFFNHAAEREQEGDFVGALAACEQALALDPGYPDLLYMKGQCHLALRQTNEAPQAFSQARDLDALRFRADSEINRRIRRIASAKAVPLIDAASEIEPMEAEQVWYDHVHLTFKGNYQLALLFAAAIEECHEGLRERSQGTWPTEETIAHHLAWSSFDAHRIAEEMRMRMRQPPFTRQLGWQARDEWWSAFLAENPANLSNSVQRYEQALQTRQQDWVLHANFARLLEACGNSTRAAEHWEKVTRFVPHNADGWFHLGSLAYDRGAYGDSAGHLKRALSRKPESVETMNALGLALAAQGRNIEAIRQYRRALRVKRDFAAARVNLAVLLARTGQTWAAIEQYAAVLRADTNHVGARINLGMLLKAEGQKLRALELFQEAVTLSPEDASAGLVFGKALSEAGRQEEAIAHFAAAVGRAPHSADLHYELAKCLTQTGRVADALPHFSQVIKLQPSFAEARFNYGIALAKCRNFAAAIEQFEKTLEIDPRHPEARAALERALQRARSSPGR